MLSILHRRGVVPEEGDSVFLCAEMQRRGAVRSAVCHTGLCAAVFDYSTLRQGFIIVPVMERATYRIIDVNFNRAREALRVMEEFCRFAVNSAQLTQRAKKLRDELSAAIGGLDGGRLMAGRDTTGDVGAGRGIDERLERSNLKDCLTAACRRLSEALRVLAETVRIADRTLGETIERIRFEAYAIEKDIVLFAEPVEKFRRVRLYVIVTSNLPAEILSLTERCAEAGADCVQLRAKDVKDDTLFAVSAEFVRICRDRAVLSVINDRVDVAVAAGADGVHLGQNDLPVEQVRRLQLQPLIVGKSTHSPAQLHAAVDEAATYVSLGPVYPTATKPRTAAVGLEYVRQALEALAGTGLGHVAIGGITPQNVEDVLQAGARTIAVCAAVTQAKDPAAACRALKEKIVAF